MQVAEKCKRMRDLSLFAKGIKTCEKKEFGGFFTKLDKSMKGENLNGILA